jgi:hypothetical protein
MSAFRTVTGVADGAIKPRWGANQGTIRGKAIQNPERLQKKKCGICFEEFMIVENPYACSSEGRFYRWGVLLGMKLKDCNVSNRFSNLFDQRC